MRHENFSQANGLEVNAYNDGFQFGILQGARDAEVS